MYNMSKFERVLKYEISIASICSLDLSISNINMNKSKSVNYIYGQIGDKVLIQLVNVAKEVIKKDILTKWEGDEFVILAQLTGLKSAIKIGEDPTRNIFTQL